MPMWASSLRTRWPRPVHQSLPLLHVPQVHGSASAASSTRTEPSSVGCLASPDPELPIIAGELPRLLSRVWLQCARPRDEERMSSFPPERSTTTQESDQSFISTRLPRRRGTKLPTSCHSSRSSRRRSSGPSTNEQRVKAPPNPSLERTSTGWPMEGACSTPGSGQPAPAAHLKR